MFSKEWNEQYQNNAQMSIWPWSDLVSKYMRYVNPNVNPPPCILELGVGAGANISFFKALNANYFALEGSSHIVQQLKQTHGDFAKNIKTADFTQHIPFDEKFDAIIDRSSLTHNTTKDIINCLNLIKKQLKPDGFFIGIDWFSTLHSGKQYATRQIDDNTFADFSQGNFTQVGEVHFSDKEHLLTLFNDYNIIVLEHKTTQQYLPSQNECFATWDFVAQLK